MPSRGNDERKKSGKNPYRNKLDRSTGDCAGSDVIGNSGADLPFFYRG